MLRITDLRFQHCGPINLELNHGECVSLSGPSGSGKTLFLRAIADLDEHSGELHLDTRSLTKFEPHDWRRSVALLPAESGWWDEIVGDHFFMPDSINTEPLGLNADVMQWPVQRLSSGERQRLALLRLLENQPQILLLDEPTANLDPTSTTQVETLLTHYRTQNNAAMVWVTHDQQQAARIAQRHTHMHDGSLMCL